MQRQAPKAFLEVVRYLIVGVINTGVGLGVIYLCLYLFNLDNVAANAIGYAVGIVCSFTLNKRWTFASEGRSMPQFARFLAVTGVAYVANLATVLGLLSLDVNQYVAQAMGVMPYTAIGFLGSRYIVFRKNNP